MLLSHWQIDELDRQKSLMLPCVDGLTLAWIEDGTDNVSL
jgi:hypothetical protein